MLLISQAILACDVHVDDFSKVQTVEESLRFKKRYGIEKTPITKYMDDKYGSHNWVTGKLNGIYITHENRPRIIIYKYQKNMRLVVLYEQFSPHRRGIDSWNKPQLLAEFNNIGRNVLEFTLPYPDRMHWNTLYRLWIVQVYQNSTGGNEVILLNTPWEYFVTRCGYGRAVVSR